MRDTSQWQCLHDQKDTKTIPPQTKIARIDSILSSFCRFPWEGIYASSEPNVELRAEGRARVAATRHRVSAAVHRCVRHVRHGGRDGAAVDAARNARRASLLHSHLRLRPPE